jgi:hypothetical protein
MRTLRALVLVSILPLALGACDVTYAAIDKVEGLSPSPFMLFMREDMRPGARWSTFAKHAKDETPMETECSPFGARGHRCTVPIQPGLLTVTVDKSGRIVRLVVVTDPKLQYGGLMAEIGRQYAISVDEMRESWSKIGTRNETQVKLGQSPTGIGAVKVTHWRDPDAHWFATMWTTQQISAPTGLEAMARMSGIGAPDSITVTDLEAWNAMREVDAGIPEIKTSFKAAKVAEAPVVNRDSMARDSVKQVASMPADRAIEMMEYDLRALTMQQESWEHAHQAFATNLSALHAVASAGVKLELLQPTATGWSARATHEALAGASCVVFSGQVASLPKTQRIGKVAEFPGTVVCDTP